MYSQCIYYLSSLYNVQIDHNLVKIRIFLQFFLSVREMMSSRKQSRMQEKVA